MDVSYLDEKRFVSVRFSGSWKLSAFSRLLKGLLKECRPRVRRRLLIDLSGVENDYISTLERYKLGVEAATLCAGVRRVATLARPDQIDLERFGETVARNCGLDLRVFSDLKETRTWLVESRRSKARPC
jgi:hypothetical protein